jgi:hypothetical protein
MFFQKHAKIKLLNKLLYVSFWLVLGAKKIEKDLNDTCFCFR